MTVEQVARLVHRAHEDDARAPIARIASTTVAFVNRLNAPPLLRVRWSSTSSPMIDSGPSLSAATTQTFVS